MADLNVQVVPGSTNVTVQDANNIQLNVVPPTNVRVEVEPVANQVIEINRGVQGQAGEGVPAGGTTGQALVKTSDANYDTEWSSTVPNAETADHATTADSATLAGNVTGIVAVVNGGTGANNATDARTNLSAAQSGTNADITSMTALTGGISSPDFVQFDTAAAAGINLGKLRWNTTSNTLAFGIIDGTDEINIGEQMVAYVANADSVTITRGQPVYLYAAQGNRASVKLASNLGDSTSAKTLGLAMQDIAPNNAGFVMTQGVLDKVNTSAFAEGVTLYLGATAGTLTSTKPKAPNHLVYIGVVERANAGNGQIYVKPQNGYELDEIHDVQITSPVNGQTIIYDQSTSLWKNANLTAGTGVTITNGPSSIIISAPDNGTVTSVAATGGTGISVSGSPITTSGTFTITNTAPDQTVAINSGTGISVTGTYPNFTVTNTSPSSGGTVTSVNTAGTVNGLTLTGGPITSSGTITLGGTLDLSSPPAIGGTTPAAGTFTTLTATGQTSLGGDSLNPSFKANAVTGVTRWIEVTGSAAVTPQIVSWSTGAATGMLFTTRGATNFQFTTNSSTSTEQFRVAHTASAVNYVQVTGAATGGRPVISTQGSDTNINLTLQSKGSFGFTLQNSLGSNSFSVTHANNSSQNYLQVAASLLGSTPSLSSQGNDTNIDITLTPKGTGQTNIGTNFANYFALSGAATTKTVEAKALGSDTNIAFTIDSKGTGAVNLAAGSSGVNISNGGTVTAITRTANGSGYTSIPSVAISAPTTAGGVQATASATMFAIVATVQAGGTGYTLNDTLTIVGGTFTTAATFTVSAVSGGVISAVTLATGGAGYSVLPTNPVSVTGGTGSGATLNITSWGVSTIPVGTAGSGYVEQPTVTFSGGGGSGAAAYASVGSGQIVRSIGGPFQFYTAGGEAFRVSDAGVTSASYWNAFGGTVTPILRAVGSTSAVIETASGVPIQFRTNSAQEQFRVSHTASAVNYVQVTGAATGGDPLISVQGSDATRAIAITAKGTSFVYLRNNTTVNHFSAGGTGSAVNYLNARGNAAGTGPALEAVGSDTNIDLTLTPKGTGLVRFGTYTAGAPTATGYISIKAADGTTYKVLVGT